MFSKECKYVVKEKKYIIDDINVSFDPDEKISSEENADEENSNEESSSEEK